LKTSTIYDVAKIAAVSIKTASRVINSQDGVSEKTRLAVWDAVNELGYRPDEKARHLARERSDRRGLWTGCIGCVMFPQFGRKCDYFYNELLEELDKILLANKLHRYFTYTLTDLSSPDLALRMLNPSSISGVLAFGLGEDYRNDLFAIRDKVANLVLVSDCMADNSLSCVCPDLFQAGVQATRYLLEMGHTRIACITGDNNMRDYHQQRLNGYKSALAAADLPFVAELVVEGGYSFAGACLAAKKILQMSPRPTAIYAVSDAMALGVYRAAYEAGLRIPEDISVAGCDDLGFSGELSPALTTVGFDRKLMLERAVMLIRQEAEEEGESLPVKVLIPGSMKTRDSCANIAG
jgi:DNA-binding LacI/PurR family transcriptional regulator